MWSNFVYLIGPLYLRRLTDLCPFSNWLASLLSSNRSFSIAYELFMSDMLVSISCQSLNFAFCYQSCPVKTVLVLTKPFLPSFQWGTVRSVLGLNHRHMQGHPEGHLHFVSVAGRWRFCIFRTICSVLNLPHFPFAVLVLFFIFSSPLPDFNWAFYVIKFSVLTQCTDCTFKLKNAFTG